MTVNEKKEGYNTSIWVVSTAGNEGPHRLTSGERDSSPRWSPDGKYLVFTRVTEKDGKPEPPQLFMLSMAGGDAFSFTNLPKGAGDPRWSPDGKTIAVYQLSQSRRPGEAGKEKTPGRRAEAGGRARSNAITGQGRREGKTEASRAAAKQAEAEAERESDIHVVTRAVYRGDDEGYYDFKRPQHIWVVPAPRNADEKVQPKQLTSGRFDEGGAIWSKDGAQIYFASLAQRRALLRSAEDGALFRFRRVAASRRN